LIEIKQNMKQIDLREGARRQHRAVSIYAMIQCWTKGLDGVVLEGSELKRLLGLKQFKEARIEWLTEDLKELFPHQERSNKSSGSFARLAISRRPIPKQTLENFQKWNTRLLDASVGKFQMWEVPTSTQLKDKFEGLMPFFADSANYDERFLTSYLALLCQGQVSPGNLPSIGA
jgi:hypothetical protein